MAVVVLLLKVMLWDSFFNTDIIHLTKTEKALLLYLLLVRSFGVYVSETM